MTLGHIFLSEASRAGYMYHGTRSLIPFPAFDPKEEGTGIVSSGTRKYGGFFFTSEKSNAAYFTEWFVLTVLITGVQQSPIASTHPPTVMAHAVQDGKCYQITGVLDGDEYSDIVVVPNSKVGNVRIVKWEFVGDQESYFEALDRIFGNDEGNHISQNDVEYVLDTIGCNVQYALSVPVFRKYFNSKERG